jgi:hypothetical protein
LQPVFQHLVKSVIGEERGNTPIPTEGNKAEGEENPENETGLLTPTYCVFLRIEQLPPPQQAQQPQQQEQPQPAPTQQEQRIEQQQQPEKNQQTQQHAMPQQPIQQQETVQE